MLPKPILEEEFCYFSDQSVDYVKADIQKLFDDTTGWNFSVNLAGRFLSEDTFEMTPRWQFFLIRSYERKISYLYGTISKDESGRTRIDFSVRPNSVFPFFFFAFPLTGLFILMNFALSGKNNPALIPCLAFMTIGPLLTIAFGYFAKQNLKGTFVRYFGLKAVE